MTFADWLTGKQDRTRPGHSGRPRLRRAFAAGVSPLEARRLMAGRVLGDETLINAVTAGVQAFSPSGDGSIAVDLDGTVIAAWSTAGADGTGTDIVARRIDAAGNPLGGEFTVNTTTRGEGLNPVVAAAPDGRFVVAWEASGNPQDRSSRGVFARVFAADATPLTGEILINASTRGDQRDPSVDWLSAETFVVAWSGAGGGRTQTAFARLFDDSGAALTDEARLTGFAAGGQHDPVVAALPGGGFQAVWRGPAAGDPNAVVGRRFDHLGRALGGQFRISTARVGGVRHPGVAVLDDQVVVVWQGAHRRLEPAGSGIIARRIGLDGTPLGPEFRVNQAASGDQLDPSVAPLADGGFVVAWEGDGDGDRRGIFAREFDADGTPRGDETRVNETVAGIQADPTVRASGSGYVVAWAGRVAAAATAAGDLAAEAAADASGVALRSTDEPLWAMPASSVGTRDEVMTFTIPGIGVISQVSPKTITFTNTTGRTVYPILESANNNVVTSNTNGNEGKGLYDPYDPVNREYRGYVGFKQNGQYFLGLQPGATVTVEVPLVFWDAGRILIASDGSNLIPTVDNVAPPPGQPNSPNPFRYHNFQNFVINDAVLAALVSTYNAPQSLADDLRPLLNQVFENITDFQNAARKLAGAQLFGQFEVPILNLAGAVIPTKRFRDDLADGVHAVLWYQGQSVGGLAEGPAGSAPAQLAEMTFRSKIFADPRYLTHKDIDPNGNSGEVHDLVNYDVSYVDSMMLPVAMEAIDVPLDPSGVITTGTASFGWVGADKTFAQLQGPLGTFTSPNPDPQTNLNGLGNYFGGQGYPKYYVPAETEALTGIKVPAGQNLALDSPVTNGRSAWDQNEFILTSAGVGPIAVTGTGAGSTAGSTYLVTFNNPGDVAALQQITPQAGWTVTINGVADAGNQVVSTTFPVVDGQKVAVVQVGQAVPAGLSSYEFDRPVRDYVMTKLADLWFSWADHYYTLFQGVTPAPSYAGMIAQGSNELVFSAPVPAAQLVVGQPVSGPGMPADFLATIIGLVYDPTDKTQVTSVKLSKLSSSGGAGTDYLIGTVRRIQPQNGVGFAIEPYTLGFTNPADPDYDARFARAVYLVMDSMNTIPVSSPTAPAIIELMANVLGGNIGFIPNIGISVNPSNPSNYSGVLLVADAIRDNLKSVLRGVDDFQTDTEDMGHWYPDPSWTGARTGQTINGQPADFNLYNLNPFVWFVHRKLGLSGYGFSLDDDAADVGADGGSQLRVVIGPLAGLPGINPAEWTHGAPYGPVKSLGGELSTVPSGQYAGMSQLTNLDRTPLPIILQVLGVGSSGEPGALVSGPGIAPGTRVLFANIGGNGVILDTPATIPTTPSGPYYFTGTPPKVATQAAATPDGPDTWDLSVLGADGYYGEGSLTYTWSLLSGPAGATPVFGPNGTNAAKNTTVTLPATPGSYVFRATIAQPPDVGGFFTTSEVTLTVSPTIGARRTIRRAPVAIRRRPG